MTMELVSICIPTYNGERYLRECLDSVLSQSWPALEILIADDCSDDGSYGIIEEYIKRDTRIRLCRNKENLGLVGNWNNCLRMAKGEWIKFIFQDDVLEKDCVEKLLRAAGKAEMVVGEREFIFEKNVSEGTRAYYENIRRLSGIQGGAVKTAEAISEAAVAFPSINFIGEPSSVMFRRSLLKEVGEFDRDLSQLCDLEYWLRIGSRHGLVYLPEKICSFRIHSGSTTAANVSGQPGFRTRYLDPLILSYKLLFAKEFSSFRDNVRDGRLKRYFRVKAFEARKASADATAADRSFYKALLEKYPEIEEHGKNSITNSLMYSLVLIKRKLNR
jgi:glycosyltransferase involved in cell wall biosynthesis